MCTGEPEEEHIDVVGFLLTKADPSGIIRVTTASGKVSDFPTMFAAVAHVRSLAGLDVCRCGHRAYVHETDLYGKRQCKALHCPCLNGPGAAAWSAEVAFDRARREYDHLKRNRRSQMRLFP